MSSYQSAHPRVQTFSSFAQPLVLAHGLKSHFSASKPKFNNRGHNFDPPHDRIYGALSHFCLPHFCLSQDHPREFSERELATVAWAVGKLEVTVDPLLAEIRAECVRRGGSSFNWHDMSNIVWAHAVTPQRGEDWDTCMAMFVSEAETKSFDKCTPQALSNLAWALSTLGVPAKALLERFALHASSTDVGLDKFKPQEISSLAWGLSVGGVRTPSFFEAVEDAVVNQHLEGYNAQKISSLVCAFAEAGASGEQLFGMVEEVIMERAMVCVFILDLSKYFFVLSQQGLPHFAESLVLLKAYAVSCVACS